MVWRVASRDESAHGAMRRCWRPCCFALGKQVAYASQFADPDNRAHIGQAKIKVRLIADLDPDEWGAATQTKMDALANVQSLSAEV